MENLNQNETLENTEGLENVATANDQLERLIQSNQLERFIQAKVDKYLAKERKEKAELKKQLDDLKKLKLTEDELKQLELEEKEKIIADREITIADRENSIRERENRLYAVKAIKEAGLDTGSGTSLGLVDIVLGEDTAKIDAKVKTFKTYVEEIVDKRVEERFKANGSTPAKGSNLNMGDNPYSKENFNFTAQMRLETENPDLAAQLRAAAGIK